MTENEKPLMKSVPKLSLGQLNSVVPSRQEHETKKYHEIKPVELPPEVKERLRASKA